MIITRSPLRISLGGGGTDLASYYSKYGGFFLAAAINKYIYITLHRTFIDELIIKYSKFERVNSYSKIEHPIIREALQYIGINELNMEITSMADIPAGTGLGSSGSFTTALISALNTWKRNLIQPSEIAEQACHIEIEKLKEPIGKQDQYIAAFGGITAFTIHQSGIVEARPIRVSNDTIYDLEDNLLLFFTGYSRAASTILTDQKNKSEAKDNKMLDNLHYVKQLGYKSLEALELGDLHKFASLMDEHWQHKKARTIGMSNSDINEWYNVALQNGAVGGKLIGAGGGGFLMFYADDKLKLRKAMQKLNLKEVRFKFDFEGTKTISPE